MTQIASAGVRLHIEEAGEGPPLLLLHELGSDARQWRGQLDGLSGRFRCIAPSARGYPPSDVPPDEDAYLWERQVADALAVLDGLALQRAAVVGWSMGAYTALQLARLHPDRVTAVVAAGVGSGSPAADQPEFRAGMRALAGLWEHDPVAAARQMAEGPTRQALRRRRPQAWAAWLADLATHDPAGMARTCRNFQALRPSLQAFDFAAVEVPVLLLVGDEDAPCLEATHWLASALPRSRLVVLAQTGHAPSLEDPETFNRLVGDFLLEQAS